MWRDILRRFLSATVRIPDERTVLRDFLGRSGAHDNVFNSGYPVPIDGNLLLLCVELVQLDYIVVDSPIAELLLSDM